MADDKIRYVLDVDDKGTPKIVKFGQAAEKSGKQAAKAMDTAGQSIQDVGGQIPILGNAMSTLAGGPMVAAAAGAAAVVGGFSMMVKSAIDFADGMNDMADRTGLAVETLSSLALVSELGGTSLESVAQILGKFSSKVAEGDKGIKSLNLTSKDSASAMIEIADRVKNAKTQTEAIAIAQRAYGKQWQEMMPILKMGGDEIKRISENTPKVSAEMAQMSAKFNDTMTELRTRLGGIGLSIANDILPHMLTWLKRMESVMDMAGKFGKSALGSRVMSAASGGLASAAAGIIPGGGAALAVYRAATGGNKPPAAVVGGTPPAAGGGGGAGMGEYKTPEEIAAEAESARIKAQQAADKARIAREQANAESAKLIADANKERNDKYLADQRNAAQILETLDARIAEAEKARIEAIEKEKAAKEELRQLNIDMAEENLKLLKQERDAYEKNLASQLGMNNAALTDMIRGKQSYADTMAQIDDTMKNYAIQKGLEFIEAWVAQQITMAVFGDAMRAAEVAKANATGAAQAAAYAPAAAMASVSSFGGAAVAGGAALAAVLATYAFADRGSSTLQGGRRMIVGENRPEEFRPTVPGQIHNTTNMGGVTIQVSSPNPAMAGRDIQRVLRDAEINNRGGSH